MDHDPTTWPIIVISIVFGILIIGLPVVLVLWGFRRFERAAKARVEPLVVRLAEIAGAKTPHPVALYAIHGLIAMSTEYTPTAYLTRQNAEEVEDIARRLRAFSYRWGLLAHGGLFVPLLVWWNYRTVFSTIASFRRSY
jgi:hypothetical protein